MVVKVLVIQLRIMDSILQLSSLRDEDRYIDTIPNKMESIVKLMSIASTFTFFPYAFPLCFLRNCSSSWDPQVL